MISGVGGSSTYEYEFDVTGSVEQVAANGSAAISEEAITVGDIEDTIEGTEASGAVAGGGDAYLITGEIASFELTGDATVYLDGERVDPATLGDNTDSSDDAEGEGDADDDGSDEASVPAAYRPPLDADAIAERHRAALEAAGTFSVESTSTLTGPTVEGEDETTRNARVNLDAGTAYHVASPTPEATTITYAEGATAYQREELEGFEEPSYEVTDLGRPLADRLVSAGEIGSIVSGVDYERAGTVSRGDRTLVRYTASGPDAVTDSTVFGQGEESITDFASTLLIDTETGFVVELQVQRTTDAYTGGDGLTTVETTLVFSDVGSTSVEQPDWAEDLKDE